MSNVNMEQDIEIVRGTYSFKFKRAALVEIKETHEGIIFMLKHAMSFNIVDNYMTVEIKARVKQAVMALAGAKSIKVDFNNSTQPVSVVS